MVPRRPFLSLRPTVRNGHAPRRNASSLRLKVRTRRAVELAAYMIEGSEDAQIPRRVIPRRISPRTALGNLEGLREPGGIPTSRLFKYTDTPSTQYSQYRWRRRAWPCSSLDPARLLDENQTAVDISGSKRAYFSNGEESFCITYDQKPGHSVGQFPQSCRGMLYFSREHGALRFRRCEAASEFESGEDLFLPNGKPWQITVRQIQFNPQFCVLRRLLLQEGLIDEPKLKHLPRHLPDQRAIFECLVRTLDPTKIGTKSPFTLPFAPVIDLRVRSQPNGFHISYSFDSKEPFPRCTGYFYYHRPLDLPPIAGSIRFRVCDSMDTFDVSPDLHRPDGSVWSLSLTHLMAFQPTKNSGRRSGLCDFLVKEGLVDEDVIEDLAALSYTSQTGQMTPTLFRPHQTLEIQMQNLSTTSTPLALITRRSFTILRLPPLYGSNWSERQPHYWGTVKMRLVLSGEGERKYLILRCASLATPVRYVGAGPQSLCPIRKPKPGRPFQWRWSSRKGVKKDFELILWRTPMYPERLEKWQEFVTNSQMDMEEAQKRERKKLVDARTTTSTP